MLEGPFLTALLKIASHACIAATNLYKISVVYYSLLQTSTAKAAVASLTAAAAGPILLLVQFFSARVGNARLLEKSYLHAS
jgi:methenyltetrahydromethanopterin cyclohydrolase